MEVKTIGFLQKLGLNKNEIKIYLDLLKHKNSSALDISKRTEIHRTNVYDSLRNLSSRGFIKEVIGEKRNNFIPMDPDRLRDYLKNQEKELDELLPYIRGISYEKPAYEEVSIQKGIFAARDMMKKTLDINEELDMQGVSKEAIENMGEGFLAEFHKERIKKGILMRTILDSTLSERVKILNKLKLTEAKSVSEDFYNTISTIICGDFVFIASFKPTVTVIKIKNKEIAEAYRQYFEVIWKHSKKVV